MTNNPERAARYACSDPYTCSDGVIVDPGRRRLDHKLSPTSRARRPRSSSTSNWAQVAKEAGAKVEAVEGFAQAVTLVKQGRVDATVNDNLAVLDYLKTTGDTTIKIAGEDRRRAASRRRRSARTTPTLLQQVDNALGQLKADGTLTKISKKYFGERRLGRGRRRRPSVRRRAHAVDAGSSIMRRPLGRCASCVIATIPLTIISFAVGLVARAGRGPDAALAASASLSRGRPALHLGHPRHAAAGAAASSSSTACRQIGIDVRPVPGGRHRLQPQRRRLRRGDHPLGDPARCPRASGRRRDDRDGLPTTLRRIVLPQAARTAVPPLSNTFISLVKDTSLASTILVTELLRGGPDVAAPTFEFFALYGVAAVYYWVICLVLSFVQGRIETRLNRYVAR